MLNEREFPQPYERQKALDKIFSSVSMINVLQGSTRLVSYFAAAATIYIIADGNSAAISTLSPVLGRLIEQIGGNVLADILDRVSGDDKDTLSPEHIRELIENELSELVLDDVLTEKEFYRAISRLRRQDEEKFQTLSQGVASTIDLLRRVHLSDPTPLSVTPRSVRPLLTRSSLIGRERELTWLRNTKGDRLLIGQPGTGKTFLFYQLAIEGHGLFVLSRDRGEIAKSLEEEQPPIVIVDDAHIERELLLNLLHMRKEIGLEFDILAGSWPGAKDLISETLHLNETKIHDLARLNADQIVEVIKTAGISGPNSLIREIREQADGRPGLAVTLTEIYKQGGGRDVWQGEVLKRSILSFDPSLTGQRTDVVIAAFSLGGETGMPYRLIASELELPILDLQQQVSYLAAAGIVWEVDKNCLSVKPAALRHSIIKDVFFTSAVEWWDVRRFLQYAPDIESAAITLINAQARGADIPQEILVEQLEKANSIAAWMSYTALGTSQKHWVLQNHPEKIIHLSPTSLELVPEEVIPRMLSAAVGNRRPLHSNPSHPMRMIQDWVHSAAPNTTSVMERRKLLVHKTQVWMETNGDSAVCLRALQIAMSPKFEDYESDPGLGNSVIISFGLITLEEIYEIQELWTIVYEILRTISINHNWEPIRDMIHEWAYPDMAMRGGNPFPELEQVAHSFAVKMLNDILPLVEERLGIKHWAKIVVAHLGVEIDVSIDQDFMLLYPMDDLMNSVEELEITLKQNQQALIEIADSWVKRPPAQIAKRLSQVETEARIANIGWPRLTPFLCVALADRVDDVFSWLQAFMTAGLDADLVLPFQRKWLEQRRRGL